MKSKIINSVIILLLVLGSGSVLYPAAVRYSGELKQREVITSFEMTAADAAADTVSKGDSAEQFGKLYEDMKAYNGIIYANGQSGLRDPFSYETAAFDLHQYDIEDQIAGYITIPRMETTLPIYLGATLEHLSLGAAVLGHTSVPVGGMNTNTVLAAHRGYTTAPMFEAVESLKAGDKIYITNLWETLTYEVRSAKVILPTDIHEVRVQEGRDMVTLITCHPYTKNYQRYVVYCERREETEGSAGQADAATSLETGYELKNILKLSEMSYSQKLLFAEKWGGTAIIVLMLCVIAVKKLLKYILKKRQQNGKYVS